MTWHDYPPWWRENVMAYYDIAAYYYIIMLDIAPPCKMQLHFPIRKGRARPTAWCPGQLLVQASFMPNPASCWCQLHAQSSFLLMPASCPIQLLVRPASCPIQLLVQASFLSEMGLAVCPESCYYHYCFMCITMCLCKCILYGEWCELCTCVLVHTNNHMFC